MICTIPLALNILLVLALLVSLRFGWLRGPQGPAGPAGPKGDPGSSNTAVTSADVSEIVKMQGEQWVHEGWVRAGSHAELQALQKPGLAIRKANGVLDLGIQ